MLKKLSLLFFIVIIILQGWLLTHLQLFGDEAFYWLEGQYLDWSYAELPAWTAWMIRLGTQIFGNNYFGVRFFSFLAYLSVFWVIYLFSKDKISNSLLVPLSIPIVSVIATMALPDIWLLFFVMWSSYYLLRAIDSYKTKDWVITGVILACSMNVHVRMWIWLFFAGIVFIGVFYSDKKIIKPALLITLPIALLGLVPVLVFNLEHGFPLLAFQFSERHPWQFQLTNFNFFLSQFLVITPVVLILWFKSVVIYSKNKIHNWIIITALVHWLFYIIMSLFADGLRTNVHWLIISYVPVLIIIAQSKFKQWAIITGSLASIALLVFLTTNKQQSTNLQARILGNSMGWQQLAKAVKLIQKQQNIDNVIADYFMTAAELAFEMDNFENIKVLSHEKNIKHGREKQLQIIGMLLDEPKSYKQSALVVVEDSTLKLQGKGEYYQSLCDGFKQLKYLQSINSENTSKHYHVFKVNDSGNTCEIPPLFYVDFVIKDKVLELSGWTVLHDVGIKSLALSSGGSTMVIDDISIKNTGVKTQFPEINDPNSPHNGFASKYLLSKIVENKFRIIATGNDDKMYYSQLYFLN